MSKCSRTNQISRRLFNFKGKKPHSTTVVCKTAGSDTQWKEARSKEEIIFLGKIGPKLPACDGASVEK